MDDLFESIGVEAILCFIFTLLWLFVTVAEVAKRHGRSQLGWVLVSFLISPIVAVLALHCLGDTAEERRRKIAEDEYIRIEMRNKHEKTSASSKDDHERYMPSPGNKTINDLYRH